MGILDRILRAGEGKKLKALKVSADLAGLTRFHEAIAALAEEPSQVAIGIEANHGVEPNGRPHPRSDATTDGWRFR